MKQNLSRFMRHYQAALFYTLPIAFILLSYYLQHDKFNLVGDVSWLTHVADRFLHGGGYRKDFYESNPPMAFLIYMPQLFLMKLFKLPVFTAFIWSMQCFILLFLLASNHLIKQYALIKDDLRIKNLLMLSLIFLGCVQPLVAFGEREHFILLLQIPYLLMVVLRLENYSVKKSLAISLGICMGIAISIKPYYLLLWLALEFFYILQTKNLKNLNRSENWTVVFFGLSYLLFCFLLTPEYFDFVNKVVIKYYYAAVGYSLTSMLATEAVAYYSLMIMFYCMIYKTIVLKHKNLINCLVVASSVSLLLFLIQKFNAYYHAFPVYAITTFVFILLLYEWVSQKKITDFTKHSITTLFVAILLCFPIKDICLYRVFMKKSVSRDLRVQLVDYINLHAAHQSVYFITAYLWHAYSTIDFTSAHNLSAYQHDWQLLALMRIRTDHLTLAQYQQFKQDKKMLLAEMANDFERANPSFVFVDRYTYTMPTRTLKWPYIKTLQENKKFCTLWKQYQFQEYVGKMAVYKRMKVKHA